jgi:RimK family alpha-L-glutamate ligase
LRDPGSEGIRALPDPLYGFPGVRDSRRWLSPLGFRAERIPYLPAGLIGGRSDAERGGAGDDAIVSTAATVLRPPRVGGDESAGRPLVAIVGSPQQTNVDLAMAWRAHGLPAALLSPREAKMLLGPGDTALARLDVVPTLEGIEKGLEDLEDLALAGARLLNTRRALELAHDKLRTATSLVTARLPHPKTVHLPRADAPVGLPLPFVLKPRHGSWGLDVFLCETVSAFEAVLDEIRNRRWFLRHGAVIQEVLPLSGRDLRVLVAGGRVVGAIQRVASPGEWRTNVALGAAREPVTPSPEACRLAIAAAEAIGAHFVGVDLLTGGDGYVVLEINGAVEFDRAYDLAGLDVYMELAKALALPQTSVVSR